MHTSEESIAYLTALIDYCDFDIVAELDPEEDDIIAYEVVEKGNKDIRYAISIGYAGNVSLNVVKVITSDYCIMMLIKSGDLAVASYFLKNALFAFEKDECFIGFFKKFFYDNPSMKNRELIANMSFLFPITVNLALTFIDDIETKAKA